MELFICILYIGGIYTYYITLYWFEMIMWYGKAILWDVYEIWDIKWDECEVWDDDDDVIYVRFEMIVWDNE